MQFNVPVDTVQVISEMVFAANHLQNFNQVQLTT